jgi:alkylation response protein AidB-like acyl-CoA dehydrogenase
VRQRSIDEFRPLFRVNWSPSAATKLTIGWGDTAERGALLAAAQLLGLAQRCVDLAVAHAQERHQFGQPIGSFQAIKHMIANAQVKIAFARPVLHAAAVELPVRSVRSAARVAHAKIAAGNAADLAARTALQVHGAMGMTREAALHFYVKRALALNYSWGAPNDHTATILARLATSPLGPAATFAAER